MPRTGRAASAAIFLALAGLAGPAASSEGGQEQAESEPLPVLTDRPPPPLPPAVIARDAAGRATMRAVRVTEPLRIDGRLDEAVYARIPPASEFIQSEPATGEPALERTDVWILFDDEHFYIVGRCWETRPELLMANEMRRDNFAIVRNDNFGWSLDTFLDRRNGFLFEVNAIGGRLDGQITNESQVNLDWNPIWELSTGRFEDGWIVEAAIPFKSLRYGPGRAQTWGLQVRRRSRWRNEISFLTSIPAAIGARGHFQVSLAAALTGLEAPPGSRSLEIKPYAIADLTSDLSATPAISNAVGGTGGIDLKYGLTQGLTADFTVNTDFAQVEADEQQVNLTRFSLFFPEKREFFLENQGLFAFGGAGAGPFGGGETPVLFYSRRIGLDDSTGVFREVPIDAGARMTGRVGRFSVGALNIQTGAEASVGVPPANFSVFRLKRDVLRRSSVGVLATRRSVSSRGSGSGETYGVDGRFSFYDNLDINTYWAETRAAGTGGDDASYRAQLNYWGDRYGVQLERLVVGNDFDPEVGFLRREDFERSFGAFRFSPRPASIAVIRKLTWEGRFDYITSREDVLETRQAQGRFGIEFENSDQLAVEFTRSYEYLREPFNIAPEVAIAPGGYDFQDLLASFELGRHRKFSGRLAVQRGTFYSGTKTTLEFGLGRGTSGGRLELTPRFSLEPAVSVNRIDLREGRFTTTLLTTRTSFTFTPLMFVSALLQYNSVVNTASVNLRLRWEYQPGSELFVVYNEQRDTLNPRFPRLENRAFVVKVNRLFRF